MSQELDLETRMRDFVTSQIGTDTPGQVAQLKGYKHFERSVFPNALKAGFPQNSYMMKIVDEFMPDLKPQEPDSGLSPQDEKSAVEIINHVINRLEQRAAAPTELLPPEDQIVNFLKYSIKQFAVSDGHDYTKLWENFAHSYLQRRKHYVVEDILKIRKEAVLKDSPLGLISAR